MKSETLKTHSDEDFRRATGVKRGTFAKMAEILAAARVERRKKRGRKPKLSPEEMLLAAREYRTYAHIAASYGIDESNMCRAIRRVEDVLVDATETPIERPQKKQRRHYSGKKKRRTVKTHVVARKSDGLIVCLAFAFGKIRGFRLFRESLTRFLAGAKLLLDSGCWWWCRKYDR